MPLPLSSIALAEKNKLANDAAWLVAMEVDIPGVGKKSLDQGKSLDVLFDDPDNPIKKLAGTGNFTFTRNTYGYYFHPTLKRLVMTGANKLRIEQEGGLFEAAGTNIMPYSEDLIQWVDSGTSVVSNQITAPNGQPWADKVTGVGAPDHWVYYSPAMSANANKWVASIFIKRGDADRVMLWLASNNGGWATTGYVLYDFTTGAVSISSTTPGYVISCGAKSYPDGWVRIWSVVQNPANTVLIQFAVDPSDGQSDKFTYMWGAQLEQCYADAPSSYIWTWSSAAQTRNADVLSIPADGNFLYAGGAVIAEFDTNQKRSLTPVWAGVADVDGYPFLAVITGDTTAALSATEGGPYVYPPTLQATKLSMTAGLNWGSSLKRMFVDGAAGAEVAYTGAWSYTLICIGNRSYNYQLAGHVKRVTFWNRKLTYAEMIAGTLPGIDATLPDSLVRVVRNNEAVVWKGKTYQPVQFEIEPIGEESKGEVPQVEVRVGNIDRVMERYILDYDTWIKNNGYVPIGVKIYVLNTRNIAENFFLYSEDLTNAAWTKYNATATPTGEKAPVGIGYAHFLKEDTGNSQKAFWTQADRDAILQNVCASVYVKKTAPWPYLYCYVTSSGYSHNVIARFNLDDGTISGPWATGDASAPFADMIPCGDGWYRIVLGGLFGPSATQLLLQVFFNDSVVYVGDGVSGIHIFGAQFEKGVVKPSVYKKTTSVALPSGEAEAEHWFELKQPKTNAEVATFLLGASNPYSRRFPMHRILKNHCRFIFRGAECQYSGVETTCDKTLTRCRELSNSTRYGGFPGVGLGGLRFG